MRPAAEWLVRWTLWWAITSCWYVEAVATAAEEVEVWDVVEVLEVVEVVEVLDVVLAMVVVVCEC